MRIYLRLRDVKKQYPRHYMGKAKRNPYNWFDTYVNLGILNKYQEKPNSDIYYSLKRLPCLRFKHLVELVEDLKKQNEDNKKQ